MPELHEVVSVAIVVFGLLGERLLDEGFVERHVRVAGADLVQRLDHVVALPGLGELEGLQEQVGRATNALAILG